MTTYKLRDVGYNTLNNETNAALDPLHVTSFQQHASSGINSDFENDDTTGVIIHVVPENTKGTWTHIEDLDSFFTRMYRYYLKGGYYPMLVSDLLQLSQYAFVVWFCTFLVHCVNYPVLFRDTPLSGQNRTGKITLADVIYGQEECISRISWKWWCVVCLCIAVWLVRLATSIYHLYYAFDTKQFYNHALRIKDSDIGWISWCSVQSRVREAQQEQHMCVHKQQITELDIYHRILRFNNYLVAMINKRLLPLYLNVPCVGEIPYLSKGLKYNLELLLFFGPWSPWENCWQLRECFKDASKRVELASQLKRHIIILALLNLILAPLIQAWQILYFFFSYAELIKRSPGSLGLRTWSLYARISLRHFNELDHELGDRLTRAHKPATKYLATFPSPVTTVVAKNIAFLSGSILGVLVMLSIYDEDVLTVEHVLTIITFLGCILAGARALIGEDPSQRGGQNATSVGEELLVRVLGHIHYLPADWRGKAHTKQVAEHFQQLFQFRAIYLLMELLSPLLCPLVLYSMRTRALDIVDFYRNFTVSVLGIGDVCSFAQMDVRRHGNPEWPASAHLQKPGAVEVNQYDQGEGGKTELSLVAFQCRNPTWKVPLPEQRRFLRSLRRGVHVAAAAVMQPTNPMYQTMLGSYLHQSLYHGSIGHLPPILSFYQQKSPDQLPNMAESSDDEEVSIGRTDRSGSNPNNYVTGGSALRDSPVQPDRASNLAEEVEDMSVSTLHLYDVHLAQVGRQSIISPTFTSQMEDTRPVSSNLNSERNSLMSRPSVSSASKENTPLLLKNKP